MGNEYESEIVRTEAALAVAKGELAGLLEARAEVQRQLEEAGSRLDVASLPTHDLLSALRERDMMQRQLQPLYSAREEIRARIKRAESTLATTSNAAALARCKANIPEIERRAAMILDELGTMEEDIEGTLRLWDAAMIGSAPRSLLHLTALYGHVKHVRKALGEHVQKRR